MPANSNIRTCRPWPRPEAQSPISALGSTLHVACIPWFRLVGPHGASRRACRGSSVVWVLVGMHVVTRSGLGHSTQPNGKSQKATRNS
jgi:hypothetical protein